MPWARIPTGPGYSGPSTPPHRWFGLDVPRSGYGIDNPDNVYHNFMVDGAARYDVHGRFPRVGPA